MPPLNVKGIDIAIKPIIKPKVALTVPDPVDAITGEPIPDPEPEPAIPIDQLHVKSQDELAAESISTQNVANKREMTPYTKSEETKSEERVEQARAAILARWDRRFNWEDSPLNESMEYLAKLRSEVEKGGMILQNRISELKLERVKCYSCDNVITISGGGWAGMRTRNNFETGLPESAYACSAACYLKLQREFIHPTNIRTL